MHILLQVKLGHRGVFQEKWASPIPKKDKHRQYVSIYDNIQNKSQQDRVEEALYHAWIRRFDIYM